MLINTKSSIAALSLLASALCLLANTATEQAADPKPKAAITYSADPTDVDSLDHIVAAVYDVISGPAGERDWDRMRGLFRPEIARLMSVGEDKEGNVTMRTLTPDEYIENAGGYFAKNPFYERELSRKVEQFGHIAHVFSTYESLSVPDGKPFDRGINSYQLLWDENRWWVVSIYWDHETENFPIPDRYLE